MPTTIREPEVTIALTSAAQAILNVPQRVLIIGQKQAAGSASGLVQNISNSQVDWTNLFGARSMLWQMIANFKKYNNATQVDVLTLSDNGTTKAVGTITVVGTATAAGVVKVIVGSAYDYTFQVPVAVNDTPTTIAANIAAAINADVNVPVVATSSLGVLSLTAVNAGTVGNQIALYAEQTNIPAGISSFTVTSGMTGGAVDPSFTNIFAPIVDLRYQTFVWPYTAAIATPQVYLDSLWSAQNNILDGVCVVCVQDTYANLLSLLGTFNSNSVNIICDEKETRAEKVGGSILEFPFGISAQFAAIRSLRRTDGASIGQFVIANNGALDAFGGMPLASLPYFNTPMPKLPVQVPGDGFFATEQAALLAAGGSIIGNNIANNGVILGPQVTTYKTDAASNPDITWHFLNYVDTASACREYFFNNLKARFAQSRLTQGAVIPGRSMANDVTIEAYCMRLFKDLGKMALLQSGAAAEKYFSDNLSVTLNLATGTVTITGQFPIVTQLRVINATFQMSFSVEE